MNEEIVDRAREIGHGKTFLQEATIMVTFLFAVALIASIYLLLGDNDVSKKFPLGPLWE